MRTWDVGERVGEGVRGRPSAPRVVVSGTGRSGTTFLMRLLTAVGVDTGYAPDGRGWYVDTTRAGGAPSGTSLGGLERHPRAGWRPDQIAVLPYVVKDPRLCLSIGLLLDAGTFRAERVICPVRDLRSAATSRVRRGLVWLPDLRSGFPDREVVSPARGGDLVEEQDERISAALGRLVAACVTRGVPLTLIPFSTLTGDPDALRALLGDLASRVTPGQFREAHGALSPGET